MGGPQSMSLSVQLASHPHVRKQGRTLSPHTGRKSCKGLNHRSLLTGLPVWNDRLPRRPSPEITGNTWCKLSEKVLAITALSGAGVGAITAIHRSRELLVLSYVNDHVLWTSFSKGRIKFWKNGVLSADP